MTPRWTPILEKNIRQLTGERKRYWESVARFQVGAAGRRSLKTELAKRKLSYKFQFDSIENPKPYTDERYFYAAPTTKQVERIAWNDLKALTLPPLIKRIWEGDLCIELITGQELWCIGLDAPSRAEGSPWNGAVLDEFADMKEGIWEKNLRPLFSDRNGWCIIIGVPDFDKKNNIKFKELFEKGLTPNPDFESFAWKSSDVLIDSEIEAAKEELSEEAYLQEYEGSFISAPGRAYPGFSKTEHVNDKEAYYRSELPLLVSCDFNWGHHNWGIYQQSKGFYYAIAQIYLQEASTENMILSLKDYLCSLPVMPKDLQFFGDYSGEQKRSEASFHNWKQIKDAFSEENKDRISLKLPEGVFRYKVQPPIATRIEKVNRVLRNAKKESHFFVNSKCTNLINDLELVSRTMLFSDQKSGKLTHASDNFGYLVHQYD